MSNPVFLINYQVLDSSGHVIKNGTMRVKNKSNKFIAQCSLEDHLKKTVIGFSRMVVVGCKEEASDAFSQILKDFNDIFGDFLKK